MDFFRKLVSQNKKRLENEKYNLDLSYVTNRIIAMAYPASGLEGIYRNRIDDVGTFLQESHPGRYLVINLSSRKYDYAKFGNAVLDLNWPNHYPCPFLILVEFVAKVANYLLANKLNTVVVHCLAGKGRKGSFIICLLLLSRAYTTIHQANSFYQEKRGVKVEYESQLRYLAYFHKFMTEGVERLNFQPMKLNKIAFMTRAEDFYMDKDFIVQILDFTSGTPTEVAKIPVFGNNAQRLENLPTLLYAECKDIKFEGRDLLLVLSYSGLIGSVTLLRVNVCLYFIGDTAVISLADSDDVNVILPKDFKIKMEFKPYDDPTQEVEIRNKMNELWKNYQEIDKALTEDDAKVEFLFGDIAELMKSGDTMAKTSLAVRGTNSTLQ